MAKKKVAKKKGAKANAKKPAAKKKPTARKVAGVAIGKIDEGVLDKYLKREKLDTAGSVEDKVKRFAEWVKANVPEESLVDCTTCGGDSHEDYPACPYCGDEGVEGVEEEKPAPPKKKGTKANKAEKPPKEVKAEVVKADLGEAAKYKLSDLDKSVKRIAELKAKSAECIYALANAILDLYTKDLWKLRRDEKGQPAYTNWKKFCTAELGMSHTHAYRLMDVANAFSQDDMKAVGATKLGILLQVEEGPMRDKLLDQAKSGASSRELRQQLEDARVEQREKAKPTDPKPPPPTKDSVTVYQAQGRVTLKLYARLHVDNKDAARPERRATKLGDDPWAEEMTGNDVRITYHVRKDAKGELVLVVDRRRA